MKQNENFDYFHSNLLNQDYAVHKVNGIAHFKDGVKYTPAEIELLKKEKPSQETVLELHILKHIFNGTIVD